MMGGRASSGDSITALASILADPAAFQEKLKQLADAEAAALKAKEDADLALIGLEEKRRDVQATVAANIARNDALIAQAADLKRSSDTIDAARKQLLAEKDAFQAERVAFHNHMDNEREDVAKARQSVSHREGVVRDAEAALLGKQEAALKQLSDRAARLDAREAALKEQGAILDRRIIALKQAMEA